MCSGLIILLVFRSIWFVVRSIVWGCMFIFEEVPMICLFLMFVFVSRYELFN